MKKDDVLKQLLALRQKKEDLAREAVIRREAAARRASHQAEMAAEELTRHGERVDAFERKLLASVVGKSMSVPAIERMKSQLDGRQFGSETLARAAVEAHASAINQAIALRDAQDALRERQRHVAKLDDVVKQRQKIAAKRSVIMDEAADDEQAASRTNAFSLGGFGSGPKGRGDE